MISPDNVYFLTYLGKSELADAGTSLSPLELELLVLLDGNATVSQVQASAPNLAPGALNALLEKLLASEHIALQEIDFGDIFGTSSPPEAKGDMPSESTIERGVSALRQNGFIVRIARRHQGARHAWSGKKPIVLVVEDESHLAELMRSMLENAGFEVRVAADREQIVAALRRAPLPDLVLLDVLLPDADGFAILAKMRQHPTLEKVPVIMVTGSATREAVLRGLLGGANGYITKPFELGVLTKAVRSVLGMEAGDREIGQSFTWEHDVSRGDLS